MQSSEIISINLWQIVISLCNLLLLFLILKKFLYKPVKKALKSRQEELESQYIKADLAKNDALKMKKSWQNKIDSAKIEADTIIHNAVENADKRSKAILTQTHKKADQILRQAQTDAKLERKKAEVNIKKEIVNVSTAITQKILSREINTNDHRVLIDSFISEIGEKNDTSK